MARPMNIGPLQVNQATTTLAPLMASMSNEALLDMAEGFKSRETFDKGESTKTGMCSRGSEYKLAHSRLFGCEANPEQGIPAQAGVVVAITNHEVGAGWTLADADGADNAENTLAARTAWAAQKTRDKRMRILFHYVPELLLSNTAVQHGHAIHKDLQLLMRYAAYQALNARRLAAGTQILTIQASTGEVEFDRARAAETELGVDTAISDVYGTGGVGREVAHVAFGLVETTAASLAAAMAYAPHWFNGEAADVGSEEGHLAEEADTPVEGRVASGSVAVLVGFDGLCRVFNHVNIRCSTVPNLKAAVKAQEAQLAGLTVAAGGGAALLADAEAGHGAAPAAAVPATRVSAIGTVVPRAAGKGAVFCSLFSRADLTAGTLARGIEAEAAANPTKCERATSVITCGKMGLRRPAAQ